MTLNTVYGRQQGVPRGSGWVGARGLLDGTGVVVPWVQALVLEGYGFSVNYGDDDNSATTVGTFGAGGIDLDEFDLLQTLPANGSVGVIPIYFRPVFEAVGTIAAVDVALLYGSAGVIAAGGTATPVNLRPDSSLTSACTIGILGDDGGTAITVGSFIYREGGTWLTGAAASPPQQYCWSIADAGYAPVIVGASRQVAGFASGQASTGFITYHWIEMPDEYFA